MRDQPAKLGTWLLCWCQMCERYPAVCWRTACVLAHSCCPGLIN